MRTVLVVLALLVAAEAADEQRVRELVDDLGAPLPQRRREAYGELAALGETIVPLLTKIRSNDPEVKRLLRELTRSARKLRLRAGTPQARVPLGSPLVLSVTFVNETEDKFLLPLVTPGQRGRGGGTRSAFYVRVGQGKPFYLHPDQVEAVRPFEGPAPMVGPGSALRLTITLAGLKSPLRRPGKSDITVYYTSRTARREGMVSRVGLEASPVTVEAYGRAPAVLEAALKGDDKKARASAIRELEVRSDAAILPVLRRNADDPDVTLAAVVRLGENADMDDFRFIRNATKNADKEVREAAVRALGHFRSSRARRTLIRIAGRNDAELMGPAVRALAAGFEHEETINCFVELLKEHQKPWTGAVCDALWNWTGQPVKATLAEVRAFEAWWLRNAEDWIVKNRRSN